MNIPSVWPLLPSSSAEPSPSLAWINCRGFPAALPPPLLPCSLFSVWESDAFKVEVRRCAAGAPTRGLCSGKWSGPPLCLTSPTLASWAPLTGTLSCPSDGPGVRPRGLCSLSSAWMALLSELPNWPPDPRSFSAAARRALTTAQSPVPWLALASVTGLWPLLSHQCASVLKALVVYVLRKVSVVGSRTLLAS